jgi:hypothetical protein
MSSAYDIQGRNCLFQMLIGDTYTDVVCAKTFSLNRAYELKETTTVGSGYDKEFRPRKKSYTITFNGVVQVASVGDKPTIKTMFDSAEGFLPIGYRLLYYDNSNNVMVIKGTVYVSNAVFDANPINLLNGTTELQGTGPIEVLDAIPVPININIVSTGDPLIGAFIQFKLINADGETMFDSGHLPEASGGNLSHPVDVTGQIESGSYYFFWQVTSDSIGNQFDLDAPPTKSTAFNNGTVNENSFGVQIYDFTANRTVEFAFGTNNPPPTCVAPAVASSNVPDGTEIVPWSGSVTLSGSQPFTLSNITKPAWMTMTISTNIVTLQGNLPSAGAGQTVSFDATNACGSVSFSDTLTIASNPNVVNINWDFSETATNTGSAFIIFKNGVQILSQSSTGSGTVTGSPGDNFEARIIGPSFVVTKEIHIEGNITGEIASAGPSSGTTVGTTFGPVNMLDQPYQIIATAVN